MLSSIKIPTLTRIPFYLVLVLFAILLSSCSTTRKDGPPGFYVDADRVPDAEPKPTKLSKYGNMDSYRVFGKTYHVMSSSKNYEERGVASWYGTKFHKQRTSSGERYNMLAMTAAHKTLPLPTYVQVTNLHNGKKIIVKVNDRGPFESNRLIDLSYVAAKKLGMTGHGTALVDVKAIDPIEFAKNHNRVPENQPMLAKREKSTVTEDFYLSGDSGAASNSKPVTYTYQSAHLAHRGKTHSATMVAQRDKSHVYLQVGAFRNKAYAERLKKRLTPLIGSPVQIAHSKKIYRVQIGPIKDVAMAKNISRKLKSVGVSSKQLM